MQQRELIAKVVVNLLSGISSEIAQKWIGNTASAHSRAGAFLFLKQNREFIRGFIIYHLSFIFSRQGIPPLVRYVHSVGMTRLKEVSLTVFAFMLRVGFADDNVL